MLQFAFPTLTLAMWTTENVLLIFDSLTLPVMLLVLMLTIFASKTTCFFALIKKSLSHVYTWVDTTPNHQRLKRELRDFMFIYHSLSQCDVEEIPCDTLISCFTRDYTVQDPSPLSIDATWLSCVVCHVFVELRHEILRSDKYISLDRAVFLVEKPRANNENWNKVEVKSRKKFNQSTIFRIFVIVFSPFVFSLL